MEARNIKHDQHEFLNIPSKKYLENHHETNQFKLLEYMKNGLLYSVDNPTNENILRNTIKELSSKDVSRI